MELASVREVAESILASLNPAQRAAVEAPESNIMVVAGAGSGKTRVLIHRFAYLVYHYRIEPWEILAVTFTNKAANEMRTRAQKLLGVGQFRQLWIGTFHSTALRILRIHHEEVGLPRDFEVIDTTDQVRIVKRILKDLHVRSSQIEKDAREYVQSINFQKERGQRARHAMQSDSYRSRYSPFNDVYTAYEKYCIDSGVVDFGEMLLRTLELWQDNEAILAIYQRRFRHILVDEFQDSNQIQEAWLRTLKSADNFMTVVGDDDQSIYGWRGAQVENLLNFNSNFDDVKRFTLEQNYRSTDVILNAANALIKHNPVRLGKQLWTERKNGELIREFLGANEHEESEYVVLNLQRWLEAHPSQSLNSVAVLYRNNALSQVVEQTLTAASIPYRITGGLRFYARAEIRDALAYMKLMQDVHSNVSMERIINTPKRSIGLSTVETLRDIANRSGGSTWNAAEAFVKDTAYATRARRSVENFLTLIGSMRAKCQGSSLASIAKICVEDSGLLAQYAQRVSESDLSKATNLEELVSVCSRFNPEDVIRTSSAGVDQHDSSQALERFLDKTSLDAGDVDEVAEDAVNLMTLHASKGLEFPLVFIVGMEERVLPNSEDTVDEERRLVFVGMTRAMDELHLTSASTRTQFGRWERRLQTRFLKEVPAKYRKLMYTRQTPRKTNYQPSLNVPSQLSTHTSSNSLPKGSRFTIGQDVVHDIFGSGTVIAEKAEGRQVQIRFTNHGVKWMISDTPKMHPKT